MQSRQTVYLEFTSQEGAVVATKIERTITVPESMYNKILKLAEEERSNVPFVTRQLLVKALADEGKNRPDWFYEIQSQIVALRNEVLVDQRPKKEEVVAGELLGQLQKQIATLTKAVSAVEKDPQVDGYRREKCICQIGCDQTRLSQ